MPLSWFFLLGLLFDSLSYQNYYHVPLVDIVGIIEFFLRRRSAMLTWCYENLIYICWTCLIARICAFNLIIHSLQLPQHVGTFLSDYTKTMEITVICHWLEKCKINIYWLPNALQNLLWIVQHVRNNISVDPIPATLTCRNSWLIDCPEICSLIPFTQTVPMTSPYLKATSALDHIL